MCIAAKVAQAKETQSNHAVKMTLRKGRTDYIATASHGQGDVLQGPDSDVRLIIPKGINCTVIGHVHTITQDILEHIPDGECLIAPIPEFSCILEETEKIGTGSMFEIKIRHCVANDWEKIIVRSGDFRKGISFTQMVKREVFSQEQGNHYTVDEEFITIYTSHFCQFLCTLCGFRCKEIQALLFGALFTDETDSLVHKSALYLCGPLYSIRDFRKVKVMLVLFYKEKE